MAKKTTAPAPPPPRAGLVPLIEACKADPNDEAARWVLADWLEEHGTEADRLRAEFIRIEAESGIEKGRPEFYTRQMARWNTHERDWAAFQAELNRAQR